MGSRQSLIKMLHCNYLKVMTNCMTKLLSPLSQLEELHGKKWRQHIHYILHNGKQMQTQVIGQQSAPLSLKCVWWPSVTIISYSSLAKTRFLLILDRIFLMKYDIIKLVLSAPIFTSCPYKFTLFWLRKTSEIVEKY